MKCQQKGPCYQAKDVEVEENTDTLKNHSADSQTTEETTKDCQESTITDHNDRNQQKDTSSLNQCAPEEPKERQVEENNFPQSLVASAHISLQLFVEGVKLELKGFAEKVCTISFEDCQIELDNKIETASKIDNKDFVKSKKERKGWQRYLGIILTIISSITFTLATLIVKMINYDTYSISFWRFQGILLPILPIIFYSRVVKKQKIFDPVWPPTKAGCPKAWFLLFFRCLTGTSAVVLQFYSIRFMSIADSSVIAFSTPVFVAVASHFCLGEKSGFVPILCGIITLGGVVVITRPPMLTGQGFDTGTLIGAGLALGCMFSTAGAFLVLRYLRQMHFTVVTVAFGVWGSVQCYALAAGLSYFQIPKDKNEWLLITAIAALSFIGQTCITLALKYEQAAIVSLCRTCDILFAYFWQFIFLGEVPDLFSLLGGVTVVLGVLIAGLRKFVMELPDNSNAKKKLWILLV